MNWTKEQKKDIDLARRGVNSLQDLEKQYGLPVATAMWAALDEDCHGESSYPGDNADRQRMEDALEKEQDRKAREFGLKAGMAAADWAISSQMAPWQLRRIIKGYEDIDPEVMDMEPAPLSGEFADGMSERDVYDAAGVPLAEEWDEPDQYADVLEAFGEAYTEAYWGEVIRKCRYYLGANNESKEN